MTSKPKAQNNNIILLSTMCTAVVFRIFRLIVSKTRRRRRRRCVTQFLFSIRKPIILSSRNIRRTDRNIHAGMVIMVRRSPVVDFEETALSICPSEKCRHVQALTVFILITLRNSVNTVGNGKSNNLINKKILVIYSPSVLLS